MIGFSFSSFKPQNDSPFQTLLDLFQQLLVYTSGDVQETLHWLTELDREHGLTNSNYGIGDFIQDLKDKGYIRQNDQGEDDLKPTPKLEKSMRESAMERIFGKLRKGRNQGNHNTYHFGTGDEDTGNLRNWRQGDAPEQIDLLETFRNIGGRWNDLQEMDIMVRETFQKTNTSTVLMIDISHSMILYGEDRITPAKNVAMALSEFIRKKYPKDTLDILVFGDEARPVEIKDIPYLQVGPYHTNTVAGLELALDILSRKRNTNRQIFMITDGKPTCLKEGGEYYKNSFGLDAKILNRCYQLADVCKKLNTPVTTFMVTHDPWLVQFVEQFTRINKGKAYYTRLDGLGEFILNDFEMNKKRNDT